MSYELHRPGSLDEALALLQRYDDAHVMAGATALVLLMRQGLVRPERVVALRDAGLAGIRREPDRSLWIGATTTIREAEVSELVRAHCPALAAALGRVATIRVRCQATGVTRLPPTPGSCGVWAVVPRRTRTRSGAMPSSVATTRWIMVCAPPPWSPAPVRTSTGASSEYSQKHSQADAYPRTPADGWQRETSEIHRRRTSTDERERAGLNS